MKSQFAEFLIKRLKSKIGHARDSASHEEIEFALDDMEEYIDALKDIVTEVIKP
jgi:hypothetical protein